MQENMFLSDFFGCIGFLPLTTQSHIRATMVKIMVNHASRQPSAFEGGDAETDGRLDAMMRRGELPVSPSTCVFWCAVALGALVRGNPVESVACYTQLAMEALAGSSSRAPDAEVALAWANLAYVYGFMGDLAKFQDYLAKSESCLTGSIEKGSDETLPMGFTEILQHREIGNACPHNFFEEVDSDVELLLACARQRFHPKLNEAATQPELYQYVMQSIRAFEQAVFLKVVNDNTTYRKRLEEAELVDAGAEFIGDKGNPSKEMTPQPPQPQEVADAMVSVLQNNIAAVRFSNLQEAVDRPSIRAGVGGLLINGSLVFEMAFAGDVHNTLNRIHRCVEVFVRYPGLCRSMIGLHFAHMLLAALPALDAPGTQEMYDRLRAVYNACRPGETSPAPPMAEWQGMPKICEDLQCRATERLIASDLMSAFSKPAVGVVPNDEKGGARDKHTFGLAGQSQQIQSGHPAAASFVPELEAHVPVPDSPEGSEARGDLYSTCDTRGGLGSDGGTERWMESTVGATAQIVFNDTRAVAAEIGEEPVEEEDDDTIAAADWLDATFALLEEVNEPGQACL
eukprot:g4584.t1